MRRAAYGLERKQFGRPAGRQPALPEEAGRHADRDHPGARPPASQAGRLLEQGRLAAEAISLLKRNNAGKALEIARAARDMHGGNGIADDYHVCGMC